MTATFYVGDVLDVLGKLPENSVDLVLTSPPFLALRSYLPADHPLKDKEGGSQSTPGEFIDWLLDVVEACDRVLAPHGSLCFELGDTYAGSGGAGGDYDPGGFKDGQPGFRGSGRTPGGRTIDTNEKYERTRRDGERQGIPNLNNKKQGSGQGWPLPKSLSLIPESFRFAMVYGFNPFTGRQTERWRLRNVIRWVRPNPPVGALGDKFRPATSELMVFCKSGKRYFDLDAVREQPKYDYKPYERGVDSKGSSVGGRTDITGSRTLTNTGSHPAGAPPLDWWNIPLLEGEEPTKMGPKDTRPKEGIFNGPKAQTPSEDHGRGTYGFTERTTNPAGSPPLDWWNIPPGGYEGAHYAVWPPELLIKPIKAMCPEQVCRTCGEPQRRIIGEVRYVPSTNPNTQSSKAFATAPAPWDSGVSNGKGAHSSKPDGGRVRDAKTLGFTDCGHKVWHCRVAGTFTAEIPWQCESGSSLSPGHEADDWVSNYRPGLVLDPFVGSGTTLAVATGHGRDAIGIDLDARNFDLALERVGPLVLQRGEVAA